jgi:hypothetical protein
LKAYNQINNTAAARERLVLAIEFRNFKWNVMLFRSKNAARTFSKAIQLDLAVVIEITAIYFDNMTIHSR